MLFKNLPCTCLKLLLFFACGAKQFFLNTSQIRLKQKGKKTRFVTFFWNKTKLPKQNHARANKMCFRKSKTKDSCREHWRKKSRENTKSCCQPLSVSAKSVKTSRKTRSVSKKTEVCFSNLIRLVFIYFEIFSDQKDPSNDILCPQGKPIHKLSDSNPLLVKYIRKRMNTLCQTQSGLNKKVRLTFFT